MAGNITHGMIPQEVTELGTLMQQKSDEIKQLVGQIDSKLGATTWEGPDAQRFKGDEWAQHKGALLQAAEVLHGAGQSAINNATEQENVSR